MSAHDTIGRVCEAAQSIATELHTERKKRLKLETENADLRHKLRTVEIALHSNAPLDALDVIAEQPQRKLNS